MRQFLFILFCFSALVFTSCKEKSAEPEVISIDNKIEKKEKPKLADASYSKAEFTIKGMTCQIGCAATIEKKLAKMEGVKSAKVNFEKKSAVVEYNEDKLSTEDITLTVVSTGNGDAYSVENMRKIK